MSTYDPNYIEARVLAQVGQKIVIFNQDNEILFLKRSEKVPRAGGWDFPGGGLEYGEDPTLGIVREVAEETQLLISQVRPVHLMSVVNGDDEFVVLVGYAGETLSSEVKLSWEHTEYRWLKVDQTFEIDLPNVHRTFLEKAIELRR